MKAIVAAAALLLAAFPTHAGSRVPPVASYRIEATLDETHRITATETVTFVNRTHRSFSDLRLHLYLNAFRNDRSTWLREEDSGGGRDRKHGENERNFGYSEINRVSLADGTDLTPNLSYVSPDDGNPDDRTVVSVVLPTAIEPGGTLVFRVDFVAKLPRIVERTGVKDDFVLGGQWFPKLGVATDAGWNCHQFHAPTEFFADFGDYDVTLTLPAENKGKVGGTGVLKEEADLPGGRIRVRFTAEDVHDFAFTACPRYVVARDSFTYKGLPNVEIVLLLQPDHRSARDRYIRAAKEGLAHYGTWYVPYPYPVLTVVDPPYGSHADGMEYPTFIVGGAPWPASVPEREPEDVTVHEFGHQVFYGILASNEFEEAHLDEGFNTYATYKTMKAVWGDPVLVKRFFGIPFTFESVVLPYPVFQRRRFFEWQLRSRSDPTVGTTFRSLDGPAAIQ
ncbi:MAG TPA: M1 family metallopeptidase, partial [Thermoanaerobaculia bacterium]|nr:M1 family metallopeptidase [Thermoanaerobaculia bacterium]